jgi:hypothetical protein
MIASLFALVRLIPANAGGIGHSRPELFCSTWNASKSSGSFVSPQFTGAIRRGRPLYDNALIGWKEEATGIASFAGRGWSLVFGLGFGNSLGNESRAMRAVLPDVLTLCKCIRQCAHQARAASHIDACSKQAATRKSIDGGYLRIGHERSY